MTVFVAVLTFHRHEFFLADYMSKIGNFNQGTISTLFSTEGYLDGFNYGSDLMSTDLAKKAVEQRREGATKSGDKFIHEFVLCPNIGFLAGPEPLIKDAELKISFDRADPATALIKLNKTAVVPTYLEIKNCVAYTEYISSPAIRSFFQDIDYNPIPYNYDDIQIIFKGVPTGEKQVRFDNLVGGNVPTHVFAALIKTSNLSDANQSSTGFLCNKVETFNISLNGSSVNGYPVSILNESPIFPMVKFFDTCGRLYNINAGECFSPLKFKSHFLWSHHFEEERAQGWLGIDMKLKEPFSEPYSIVVWLISPRGLTIDKYHRIEKINL